MANGITLSTSSNLTSGQKILVKEAKLAFEPAAPSPDLVGEDMLPPGHKTRDLAYYARLAQANALTEGVDLAQVEQLVTVTTSVMSPSSILRSKSMNCCVPTATPVAKKDLKPGASATIE